MRYVIKHKSAWEGKTDFMERLVSYKDAHRWVGGEKGGWNGTPIQMSQKFANKNEIKPKIRDPLAILSWKPGILAEIWATPWIFNPCPSMVS